MNFELNEYAKVLKIHPRTILRHLSGKPNPYWVPDYNPRIPANEVAESFELPIKTLLKVLRQRDSLLTQKEAIDLTGIKKAAFQYRGYEPIIRMKKIVRYLYSRVIDQHLRYM